MIFDYKVINDTGSQTKGTIDALNKEVAISSLQRRGFIILDIKEQGTNKGLFSNIEFFDRVKQKDVVILSRQIATLFEAGVSALKVFRLLSAETENVSLQKVLTEVSDDLQGGSSISNSYLIKNGAYKITYLPTGLKIIQRGNSLTHYEIVPTQEITVQQYNTLCSQIQSQSSF